MSDNDRIYGVATTAFHGGGILFKTSSPREAYRWRRKNHDGCGNGDGCEGFVYSDDGGETWRKCEILRGVKHNHSGADRHDYADGSYIVETDDHRGPLKPARETNAAGGLALK